MELCIGRLFIVVARATEPAHSSFSSLGFGLPFHATICNFPLGVFPPKLGPSTRKTVHRLVVQINRGRAVVFSEEKSPSFPFSR